MTTEDTPAPLYELWKTREYGHGFSVTERLTRDAAAEHVPDIDAALAAVHGERGYYGFKTEDGGYAQLRLQRPAPLTASHCYSSGGTYADTETVVTWTPGSSTVDVHIRCLPGLVYWSRPPADVTRKHVDALIRGHGVKRDGPRLEVNSYMSGWKYRYYVKPLDAPEGGTQ